MLGQRVDHYAADHGLQVATVRKRIQRGHLAGYKGTDHRWYVLDGETPDATQDRTGPDARHDATRQDATPLVAVNANARAQLEAIRDEWLQPLVATISQQAERIGRLETERDGVSAQLAAKNETIAELRRRAEQAEAERDRLTAAQAAQDGPGAQEASAAAQGNAPGVWGRLARWWRGA